VAPEVLVQTTKSVASAPGTTTAADAPPAAIATLCAE